MACLADKASEILDSRGFTAEAAVTSAIVDFISWSMGMDRPSGWLPSSCRWKCTLPVCWLVSNHTCMPNALPLRRSTPPAADVMTLYVLLQFSSHKHLPYNQIVHNQGLAYSGLYM